MTIEPGVTERGDCPNCGVSFDGGSIWQHFYDEFTTVGYWKDADGKYTEVRRVLSPEEAEVAADKVAESYGATRDKGQWGRQIGVYSMERDRTVAWRCPDCLHEWPRLLGRE